jgi:hypothetical protein
MDELVQFQGVGPTPQKTDAKYIHLLTRSPHLRAFNPLRPDTLSALSPWSKTFDIESARGNLVNDISPTTAFRPRQPRTLQQALGTNRNREQDPRTRIQGPRQVERP